MRKYPVHHSAVVITKTSEGDIYKGLWGDVRYFPSGVCMRNFSGTKRRELKRATDRLGRELAAAFRTDYVPLPI